MATMVASNTTTNWATHSNPSAGQRLPIPLFLLKSFMVVTRIPMTRSVVNL